MMDYAAELGVEVPRELEQAMRAHRDAPAFDKYTIGAAVALHALIARNSYIPDLDNPGLLIREQPAELIRKAFEFSRLFFGEEKRSGEARRS